MNNSFVFFGTPYVARDTLAYLLEHGYTPQLVVTSPDAPRGRGMVLTPCETKVLAQEHNLPVFSPEKLNEEAREHIRSFNAEYAIVVAYGKIFPRSFFELFPKGMLNVHYSLLPKLRGASPVETALLMGDTTTGVTVQKMVHEMDAGDIVAQTSVPIEETETTRELRRRLVGIGAELLVRTLPSYLNSTASLTAQHPDDATFCHKLEKKDGEVTLGENDEKNWRTYRAFTEAGGTYFFTERNGICVRVKIISAKFTNGVFTPLRVIPEGKKEMDYADFVK